ncbi:hypothetical protein GCM10018793_03060 [Streptomyces sulfonofaciens]|uniref:Subtilisin inhibitor domain-containing protein n=1 Tax=Streptomyces sulfonofaciens TaxID=68272 RepID=A0A919FQ71_9ACTN|nr:SSI family serine proteinase inhibitor [Streptomyces sulfonofaciens]GHH69889.1 hypothetical protein GCM10018793_03060 [Streptomyces sulfonofaciens]
MLHRLALAAAASLAALAAAPAMAHADVAPMPLSLMPLFADHDQLTVTVTDAGTGIDGSYVLECRPNGGTHPNPVGACGRLGEMFTVGRDPFAPLPERSICTLQYGGPATAHVTGTWQGRVVDARFKRTDGCEVSRWDALVPVLPSATPS